MFDSFKVKNFRGLKEVELSKLSRINLIAGKNNTGKTALLEAVFLHLGPHNPNLSLIVSTLRGHPIILNDSEETWGWLFFGKGITQHIEITSWMVKPTANQISSLLEIYLEESKNSTFSAEDILKHPDVLTTKFSSKELILNYKGFDAKKSLVRTSISERGLKSVQEENNFSTTSFPAGVFLDAHTIQHGITPMQFSKIKESKQTSEVVELLRLFEPRLKSLELVTIGNSPVIYGDIDGLPKLIPLSFMGDGIRRFLDILMALYYAKGGYVLIDEIENGIHYSVMKKLWTVLVQLAEKLNVQIFATTHSWECLKSLCFAFEENKKLLSYYRLERTSKKHGVPIEESIQVFHYDWEKLQVSIESEYEVR